MPNNPHGKQMAQDKRVRWSSKFSNFYKGVLFTGSGTAITIVALFLETMIAVRLMDKASYGIYILLIAIVNLLVMVVDLGSKTAITQLMAGSDLERKTVIVNSVLLLRTLVIAASALLIWFSRDLFLLNESLAGLSQYVLFIPIMLAVTSVDELFFGILQGFHAYKHIAGAQILRSIVRLILTATLLFVFDMGVLAVIYSWIFSFAVAILYQYFVMPIPKKFLFQGSVLSEILRFGFPIYLTRFMGALNGHLDALILGAMASPASVAIFAVAARIPVAIQRLFQSFTAVYYPTVATLISEGKDKQAHDMFNRSLRMVSMALTLVALIGFLFRREIITLLFSVSYADSTLVFGILLIAMHMHLVVNLMGFTMTAAGFPARTLGENAARITVGLTSNFILTPIFSHFGPAWASVLGNYIANPVAVKLLRRSDFQVYIAPYAIQTALLLAGSAFSWWFNPASWLLRVGGIALFISVNFMLSTVLVDDVGALLPESIRQAISRRITIRQPISLG